ncbi:MAG: amino acid permease [Bacteroidetes bacterium]|mgnify:CR=1 FL=1|nr:MAG: amino acid permease [Bacteroidota bacterium]REK06528.1 MAG: amino acid permease [Bacteroidota bacterium]REK33294.1 MAG: amino acid permease [Bacteroidota bacterium]REK49694.1 MAG: amino acid permease [Bacteroidota bacterium]
MKLFRKKPIESVLKQSSDSDSSGSDNESKLARHLGVRDLVSFGIAAIIGAGIFSTIGNASANGGPGVVFLFLFTALACGFAAFAYAEFASLVPVSGSAYTYSYVAFGELLAWIIGWALIMEYAIGNITVAISWSDYLTGLLVTNGIQVPAWMSMDFLTAMNGFKQAESLMLSGKSFENLSPALQEAHTAWSNAPTLGGLHLVADIPALLIIIFITWLVYKGIKESRNASNAMVVIKVAVVIFVIIVGAFYVNTENWNPFMPNGITGVLKGVSAVFFAYIGFDAISTTAEECKNPQRDLPRGMMWSILICTVLYIGVALVLTGMIHYSELAVGDPLAYVFAKLDLTWISGIIALSAIVAMASVLLVFALGQPRIWMSMSRDGLLPKKFASIHPRYKTPGFATIITGVVTAVPALFMNITIVTDLVSIGTLFAFVVVCAGVLRLQTLPNPPQGKFKTPYINSRYIFPVMLVVALVLSMQYNRENVNRFFSNDPAQVDAVTLIGKLETSEIKAAAEHVELTDPNGFLSQNEDLELYLNSLSPEKYSEVLQALPVRQETKMEEGWDVFKHKIPFWIFLISCLYLTYQAIKRKLSLIPLLGLVSCLYMMSELDVSNWTGFGIWLVAGLVIYFGYSYKNSKLRNQV